MSVHRNISKYTLTTYNTELASNPSFIRSMFVIVRASAQTSTTFQEELTYNFEDITVVGGAAYNIFCKQLKKLPPMKTSDIDMVWWTPQKVQNDVINDTVKKFRDKLLDANRVELIQDKLKHLIGPFHDKPIETIEIYSSEPEIYYVSKPGKHHNSKPDSNLQDNPIVNSTIRLSIIINGTHIIKNICEFMIHNGISSQGHRLQGNRHIEMLANTDPIYCDHTEDYTMLLSKIRVPTIERYITQQLFSYTQILTNKPDIQKLIKANICLERVLNFCQLNNPKLTDFIDEKFSEAVTNVHNRLITIREQALKYITEVQQKILELGLEFPITMRTTLKYKSANKAHLNFKSYASQKFSSGGKHLRYTCKRSKKNKRKTRYRSLMKRR